MNHPFHSDFIQHLENQWPQLKEFNLNSLISDQIISHFKVDLPKSILTQIKDVIFAFNELRMNLQYIEKHKEGLLNKNLFDPKNRSMMMSYDFHIDENHNIKLIEVNTNAAFLGLGYELYQSQKSPLPVQEFDRQSVMKMIQNEVFLNQEKISEKIKIAIIDNQPENQRLYSEFLLYKEWFKSFGWNAEIINTDQISSDFDLAYNRDTDFYLNSTRTEKIKSLWLQKKICLSPNPFEYYLLADKQRMIEWSEDGFLESLSLNPRSLELIKKHTPKCFDFEKTTKESIWSMRKNLFIKPKNGFGSKSGYRAAKISRKLFDDLPAQEFIAQEFIPAPEKEFLTPKGIQSFKYDIRCYAYEGELQLVMARLYQGQVTNSQTEYGGFATVQFI